MLCLGILSLRRETPLADIPFPLGLSGSVKLPKTQTNLINCWNDEGVVINRPGITERADTGLVARGAFVWNENLYQVVSTSLIKITNVVTGAYSVIGTIAGADDIDAAIGFNHACIIVKGGNGYTLDSSDTLTQMVSAQFVASNSVTHINGRFVFIPSDGDPAFFSDVGDADSIQTSSLFDAEELPDKNTVTINLNNNLYIGGTDSFELFRDTGVGPNYFARLNARVSFGYIGGMVEYSTTFLFVGREKDQGQGIYAMDQGLAIKISNELIDNILIQYTVTELQNIRANRFKWNGYDVATFKLSNHSFGFLKGNWFELTTQVGNETKPWSANFITHFAGSYYIGHNDKIGVLADVPTDYGNPFEKAVEIGFTEERDFTANALELFISQGYNAEIGSVALQLSHDNVLYTEPFYRQTGDVGEYYNKLEWVYPGGLGYYEGFMGLRLTTTESINFSSSKLIIT